ncbi:MAG: isoprenylcysteine carboxylmethyltransferase family protein [Candidatus Thorarchaeota archaeon]|nr:isoprenylcysteine carboxylmethyltransferase family protein [Candidatus Thorarchaeota archaeon]
MNEKKNPMNRKRFIIISAPIIVFIITLIISILFVQALAWPMLFFPALYPSSIFRVLEMVLGVIIIALSIGFITSGFVTLSFRRAYGVEVEQTVGTSLISTGIYGYCRHPMTLGYILLTPGLGLIFDFIPLLLNTLIATPFMIAFLFYEEFELLQRFDFTYTKYRERVPFLIPRAKGKKKKSPKKKGSTKKDKLPKPEPKKEE